jgi:tetratricopeptide (TPR) repeat protein
MASIADPRFLPILVVHAQMDEPEAAIRQAAVRGLGLIGDRSQVTLVIERLQTDASPRVREAATETLGLLGTTFEHLKPLRDRLDPKVESVPSVAKKAWEAYRLIFGTQLSATDRTKAIDSWEGSDQASLDRRITLLTDQENRVSTSNANPRELAKVREQLGDAWAATSQPAKAAAVLDRALEVIPADQADERARVAGKLLEAYLQTPAPDKAIAVAKAAKAQTVRNTVAERLLTHMLLLGETDPEAALRFLNQLTIAVPDQFGTAWAAKFDAARQALESAPSTRPATTAPATW